MRYHLVAIAISWYQISSLWQYSLFPLNRHHIAINSLVLTPILLINPPVMTQPCVCLAAPTRPSQKWASTSVRNPPEDGIAGMESTGKSPQQHLGYGETTSTEGCQHDPILRSTKYINLWLMWSHMEPCEAMWNPALTVGQNIIFRHTQLIWAMKKYPYPIPLHWIVGRYSHSEL